MKLYKAIAVGLRKRRNALMNFQQRGRDDGEFNKTSVELEKLVETLPHEPHLEIDISSSDFLIFTIVVPAAQKPQRYTLKVRPSLADDFHITCQGSLYYREELRVQIGTALRVEVLYKWSADL